MSVIFRIVLIILIGTNHSTYSQDCNFDFPETKCVIIDSQSVHETQALLAKYINDNVECLFLNNITLNISSNTDSVGYINNIIIPFKRLKHLSKLCITNTRKVLDICSATVFQTNILYVDLSLNHLDDEQFYTCKFIQQQKRMLMLRVNYNELSTFDCAKFTSFEELERLHFQGNKIARVLCPKEYSLVSLRYLNLSDNQINVLDSANFSGLQHLKKLYLNNNKIKSLDVEFLLTLSELQVLELANNDILYLTESLKIPSNRIRHSRINLKTLILDYNCIVYLNSSFFMGFNQLQHLSVIGNSIVEFDCDIFVNLPKLKLLELDSNKINKFPCRNIRRINFLSLVGNQACLETTWRANYDFITCT